MSLLALNMAYEEDDSLTRGAANPLAGSLCLFGFLLHIILSDPLLGAMGFDYSGDGGAFYEKIHPGSLFIFLSFFVLLCGQGNPIKQILLLCQRQLIPFSLLLLCILFFIYMVIRSGAAGMAFMIDTHMTPPICAIVLCYTPASYCKRVAHVFVALAFINSLVGIAESIGKFRVFGYDETLAFMREDSFRASALRGHPLNNASFTAIALMVVLGMPYNTLLKTIICAVMSVSLISFGGRAALGIGLLGLMAITALMVFQRFRSRNMSLLQLILIVTVTILGPLCLIGALYVALASGMGERLIAHAHWDDSAQSRTLAFMVFDYLSTPEIFFGVSTDRILDIAYQMNLAVPLSDIENPWLLMCLYLGVIAFPIWLAATLAFIYWVLKDTPFALKLALLSYFAIASTSNSFGRKDSTYLITVTIVMCAMRVIESKRSESQRRAN
ncbi:MAG: VpsF family polysaccharide biosynthesis protein [Rickettsiales bacterium]